MATVVAEDTVVERTRLGNGTLVVSERVPSLRSLCLGVWILRGSRHEPRPLSGILHFIEHMLFKGTETRDTQAIARVVDATGGEMNAFTGKEATCFYTRVLDGHLPVVAELLGDLILHPTFRDDETERERKVILEEIKMVHDTPDDLVHDRFLAAFWKGSSLARPVLGTRRTVSAIAPETLREFYRDNVRPNSLLVAAAGAVDHRQLVELLEPTLGTLRGEAPAPALTPPKALPAIHVQGRVGLRQTYLCLGTPAFPRNHPDHDALAALSTILGSGMSSRLFQRVREQRSLAYDVYSDTVEYLDAGYLFVYAGTSADAVAEVIRIVLDEFRSLRASPVASDELQRAKEQIKGSLFLGLESTFNRMSHLAGQEIYGARQVPLDDLLGRIDAVTAEDVLRVARQILDPEALSLTVYGKLPEGFHVDRAALTC